MTYILAEIASAHVGDPEKLSRLVHNSIFSGADGLKFQIWQESEIRDHPKYENLKRFEITREVWKDIVDIIREAGFKIDIWIELIGTDSLEFAKTLRPDYWKIPFRLSGNIDNAHNIFWRYDKPIDLHRNVAIGEQGYPTNLRDSLEELDVVKFHSDNDVLYADHSNIELTGYPVAKMAKNKGAWGIEKHICLNREELKKDSQDYISALEPDEFKDFVEAMK